MAENKVPAGKNDASDLAELIDRLMSEGSGHINITTDGDNGSFKVDTVKSTDCSGKKGACCQPTELSADEDDD